MSLFKITMKAWLEFINGWSTPGGTIVLLFILTNITFILSMYGMPKAEEITYLVVGALLGVLRGDHLKRPDGDGERNE